MSNVFNQKLSTVLTQQEVVQVKQLLDQIEGIMPFLTGLTPKERKQLPKINRDNKLFVEDVLSVSKDNAGLMPPFLDVNELEKDYLLYTQLDKILEKLRKITEMVRDTQLMAGSEAFTTSLKMYEVFRVAAKSGVPGSDSVVDKLSVRFSGQGPRNGNGVLTPIEQMAESESEEDIG